VENILTVHSRTDMQLPRKSSLVNFSLLSEIVCPAAFRSFSIKYVCSGLEEYEVSGYHYQIKSGQYLLANHFAEGMVRIDKPVKGICIDISPDILSEVVASRIGPDTMHLDLALDKFFTTSDFLDAKYNASDTQLGRAIRAFERATSNAADIPELFTKELYYSLAESIVADHIPLFRQLQSIRKIKMATRKDLLRRVTMGKEYLDAQFLLPLEIADVARECNLSEYHFFRTFRQVFSISPYQYLIARRLDFAKDLLREGHDRISDIAYLTGYSDVFAFSKSFKKYTGSTPTQFGK